MWMGCLGSKVGFRLLSAYHHEEELQELQSGQGRGTVELGGATSWINHKSQLLIPYSKGSPTCGGAGSMRVYATVWGTSEWVSWCAYQNHCHCNPHFSFPVTVNWSPEGWSADIPFSASPIKMCIALWQHNLLITGELLSQVPPWASFLSFSTLCLQPSSHK